MPQGVCDVACLFGVDDYLNQDILSRQTRAFPQFGQKTAFGGIALPQNLQLVGCRGERDASLRHFIQ
jgi:hypothetical protein